MNTSRSGEARNSCHQVDQLPEARPVECLNCNGQFTLTGRRRLLYCSEECTQIASAIRYGRRLRESPDGHDLDAEDALRIKIGHALVGGYNKAVSAVPDDVRQVVLDRELGRCQDCGQPGNELHHLAYDEPGPDQLMLLCNRCHMKRTLAKMTARPSPEQAAKLADILDRIKSPTPLRVSDDAERWPERWRDVNHERRQQQAADAACMKSKRCATRSNWLASWPVSVESTSMQPRRRDR